MRPYFGHVKNVPLVRLCLLGSHELHIDVPDRIIASLNRFEHILDHVVGVFPGNPVGLVPRESLIALLSLHMDLGILERAVLTSLSTSLSLHTARITYLFYEFVGVSTVRVHVANRSWSSPIAKKHQKLVDAFWIADVKTSLVSVEHPDLKMGPNTPKTDMYC